MHAKNLRAPSYFNQFFEDQVRQNEESGGVRTLYIDRDPITFRDVARHLQGKGLSVWQQAFTNDDDKQAIMSNLLMAAILSSYSQMLNSIAVSEI